MWIYDQSGGLMYTAKNNGEPKFMCGSSDFAFVHIESLNAANGLSSIYTVTITLGVDTPQSAWIEFNPPDEIPFLPQDGYVCRGTQNLQENLICYVVSNNVRRISLISDNTFDRTPHKFGTTI